MEPKYVQISAPLETIDLHVANPRFDPVEDQRAAIHAICLDQGVKLIELAEDIVHEGTSPIDLTLVIKGSVDGRYIVAEGNRRITALKLLAHPARIEDTPFLAAQKKRLKQLASKFDARNYANINCVLASKIEDTHHWVQLRHTGQNKGAGIVEWTGAATARFRGNSRGYDALEFVRTQLKDKVDEEILDRFPITNLERLLADPDIRKPMGLSLVEGKLHTVIDPRVAAGNLYTVMKDLRSPNVGVGDVYTKEDRRTYLKRIAPQFKTSASLPEPRRLDAEGEGPGLAASPKAAGKAVVAKKGSTPSTKNRITLIPRKTNFPIESTRVNEIYRELKNLKVTQFPNAVAVLARVFLELSLDVYIQKHKLKSALADEAGKGEPRLNHKVICAKKHLITNGAEKSIINAACTIFTSDGSPLSIKHLHTSVHNPHWHPDGPGLVRDWDTCEEFFKELWSRV